MFDFGRGRKALENRQNLDDDRIVTLERMVKESSTSAEEAERKYDEVGTSQAILSLNSESDLIISKVPLS